MTTEGIAAVYVETHNWGKSAAFFKALGYELDFETDHHSGLLRNGSGPYVFVAEVSPDAPTSLQLVLRASDSVDQLDASIEVLTPMSPTHFGTHEMVVLDPDGRPWTIQAP